MSNNSLIIVHRVDKKTQDYKKHPYYTALYRKLKRSKSPIISLINSEAIDKTQHSIVIGKLPYLACYDIDRDVIMLGKPETLTDNLILPEITFRNHHGIVVRNVDYLKLILNWLEHETLHQIIDKLINVVVGSRLDNTTLEYERLTEYWLTEQVTN